MKSSTKRTVAIILIAAIALAVGFAVDALWSFLEKRSHPISYSQAIDKYSVEYNIPKAVIYAVIKTESDFDAEAVSSAGAVGLMQMMPSTFEWLTGDEHLGEHLDRSALKDPEVSIRYGTYYLQYLRAKFAPAVTDGETAKAADWEIILAAYNAGEGNVSKWLSNSEYSKDGKLTNIPFSETKSYVSKVMHAIETYKKLYPEQF